MVTHLLLTDTGLAQVAAVHADDEPFPATLGWHPWFRRELDAGAPLCVELPADRMLLRDAAGIPDGRTGPVPAGPWDDCFGGVRWPVVLRWPGALRLDVSADTDWVVVFDERDEAVCVEPQTGPPNDVNASPRWVSADAPLTATTTWTCH